VGAPRRARSTIPTTTVRCIGDTRQRNRRRELRAFFLATSR
jgi:hypothetical protein